MRVVPAVYVPQDRRLAYAEGRPLPDRSQGAALFADISGFTPLTEALVRALGPQRGAEELTRQLNLVFDALINHVDRYRGSVIGFSGDAITCWFDADDGRRAAAAALEMQQAMKQFANVPVPDGTYVSLAMKASVAAGPARRFLVGDPHIQVIDVLAGRTLDRLAAGEHLANRGDVILDPFAFANLEGKIEVADRRSEESTGQPYTAITQLALQVQADEWPEIPPGALTEDLVRSWLLPPVYERAASGPGEFLAELRPAVALFLRFGGIDYDREDAGPLLDAYIRWVQAVLFQFDEYLLQVTVGDKGSYLYAPFGAPVAHGDDAIRAGAAALRLCSPPAELSYIGPVQIGISQGRMRTGPYGGRTRRTFGVLGDEVNLAARLMTAAQPGQIMVSRNVRQATGQEFEWEVLTPIRVKGKRDPIPVYLLRGPNPDRSRRLREPEYDIPMVGRADEKALIEARLQDALRGKGQIIGITGEAGMGKSRLIAEGIRLARTHYMLGYFGECQSYGMNNSYHAWHGIWRDFFGVGRASSVEEALPVLERELGSIHPALVPRLPLLGTALNLPIPDNDLTRSFDAQLRKSSLEGLLLDCVRARVFPAGATGAGVTPLLIVIEDGHWLDPLSAELLDTFGHSITDWPVLILVAYRPPDPRAPSRLRLRESEHFTEIALADLPQPDAEQLVTLKLAQLSGSGEEPSSALIGQVLARGEGNPFFIVELINYLRDRGIDPQDPTALDQLDLPTSLESLILSRIDQLTESQKITLKVASIVGRIFRYAWLWGVYPQLGLPDQVNDDLRRTDALELTALDSTEPETVYLFKHIVTQEVTYESLVSSTRSQLHEQLARFVERTYASELDPYVDLLAFHYERSQNEPKKREYLRRAGDLAQSVYANTAAISYYERLLPLLPEGERVPVLLRLGQAYEFTGKWDSAREQYEKGLAVAEKNIARREQAQCSLSLAVLLRKRGQRAEAAKWNNQARALFELLADAVGMSQTLMEMGDIRRLQGDYEAARELYDLSLEQTGRIGNPSERQSARAAVLKGAGTVAASQGHFDTARQLYEESLELLRALGDKPGVANLLNNLGIVARFQGNYTDARRLHEEALAIRRELGDRWAISMSLSNLGNVALDQGDYARSYALHEEAVGITRLLGAKKNLANSLNNLGNAVRAQGLYEKARALYDESLAINAELGDKWDIAYLLEDLGCLAAILGEPERALHLVGAAGALRESIGAPLSPAEATKLEQNLASARAALGSASSETALQAGRNLELQEAIDYALGRA